ncbi:MAG TPA: YihY/virulence factor BrkB family protein, partial [Solirubrobacteraceae bacterium]|nr:YihY/virulence factor BrkB family protein [Solirubrobacteraceae bacterium]
MSTNAPDWEGQTLLDPSGDKIGTIEEIYLVEETGRAEWARVKVDRLRRRSTLAPLLGAQPVRDGIRVTYDKAKVKEAPPVDAEDEPSEEQVAAVYRHYGIDPDSTSAPRTNGGADSQAHGGNGVAAVPQERHHGHDGHDAQAFDDTQATHATHQDRARQPAPGPHSGARRTSSSQPDSGGSMLKRIVAEFKDDKITHWAAALTYYGVLSIFPALIALVAILGLIGSSAIQPLIDNLGAVAPGPAKDILTGALESAQAGSGHGILFVVSLAAAIWAASGYINGFMDASNAIYDVEEGRSIWKKLPLRVGITVLMLILLTAGALAVVLTGPIAEQAGNLFGVGSEALSVWDIAKWPVLALIVSFMFALLYYASPNVKQPGVKSVVPGGAVAVILWVLASVLFAFYVASFGSYNKTYGTMGGVIVFLVWLWLTNIAILLGAEFNAERARQR